MGAIMKITLRHKLKLLIICHYIIALGLALAPIPAFIHEPWYVWLPIGTFVARMAVSRSLCPLSIIECKLERKLGLKQHKKFTKEWLYIPNAIKNWRAI